MFQTYVINSRNIESREEDTIRKADISRLYYLDIANPVSEQCCSGVEYMSQFCQLTLANLIFPLLGRMAFVWVTKI
jgi:hypothetical protein